MKSERKVILYIAQSLDGFIAREDDDISWLSVVEREGEDYGYQAFVDTVDTVFMGRRTYEKVLSFGIEFPHKDKACFVLTNSRTGSDENVTYFNGNLETLIQDLKSKEGGNIFTDGGAEAVRAFKSKDLIDEYVVSIIPIMLGKGIRLFKETDVESALELIGSKSYDSGLVQLNYRRVPKVV